MHLKISSAKWQPFCRGQDELMCSSTYSSPTGYTSQEQLAYLVNELSKMADSSHRQKISFTEPTDFHHMNDQQLSEFMHQTATQYPEITRLYSIGKSVQNRDLWVMEITDLPGVHEPGRSKQIINHSITKILSIEMTAWLYE